MTMNNDLQNCIKDENGKVSSARLAFWIFFTWMLVVVSLHIVGIVIIAPVIYGLMSTAFLFLGSWLAGPRIAQHILPQVGSVVNALSQGKLVDRQPDRFTDDESGAP